MEDVGVPQKRRRVMQACETCRMLKSKCDGKRPVCSRCRGYGYTCRWRDRSNRSGTGKLLVAEREIPLNSSFDKGGLRGDLSDARDLLLRLREKVSLEDQHAIDSTLTKCNERTTSNPCSPSQLLAAGSLGRSGQTINRYLGEVSDVSFYNSVKDLLQISTASVDDTLPMESYERESAEMNEDEGSKVFDLPDRETADKFVDVYFNTIHVAYPFICRQQFMMDYQSFWEQESALDEPSSFNALLLTILAIGSYYNVCTFPSEETSPHAHTSLFRRAVLVACRIEGDRCIENVRILLAQCFYLLATCQTDRCWTTLGLAIRTAQSIGLHVEGWRRKSQEGGPVARELRRRTWHSLYVLDRLLSLQLGRPSAIRNQDCNVQLPARIDDTEFDISADQVHDRSGNQPETGDYFIAVIDFSKILGHVMRSIYRPCAENYTEAMLARTNHLDAELLNWRSRLPRYLRFDRGHTFERSAVLKRQRNMLGIKFHHLRALIHRPYLCLPWLQRNDTRITSLLESHGDKVVACEQICVTEAQETAHMLHDVTDKRSLVEDFPWWQMISCLIAASSILLVMQTFAPSQIVGVDTYREALEDDADTCLKVFEALSANSEPARVGQSMLQSLRNAKGSHQSEVADSIATRAPQSHQDTASDCLPRVDFTQGSSAEAFPGDPSFLLGSALDGMPDMWQWDSWPSEIADSMTWSSQFVGSLDSTVLTNS